MTAALAGLRRYQSAERRPRPPQPPEIARVGRAALRDYGGHGRPVLFVPSLINPPHVLDLSEERSLLRWLATRGLRPLLVDWGTPDASERSLDITGHVEQLLLPLIAACPEPPVLVGYCLGGTMAIAAATRTALPGLALIATPWDFDGYPDADRTALSELWAAAEPSCDLLGMMPMELLQSSFWRIDPARTVAKFEAFGRAAQGSVEADGFVTLEDWANDGPPLTYAAARELFDELFDANVTGRGRWQFGGGPVDPASLACPILNIVSITDRIVPAASAPTIGERLKLELGHVGMVVGGRARAALWEPLAHWLLGSHLS